MTADNQSDAADKMAEETTNPQHPGDEAQVDDGVPHFVSNSKEFNGPLLWLGVISDMKHRGWLLFLGFAVLYAMVFDIVEWVSPQLYREWLNFCLPLTEYFGGLTPHADRKAAQLVASGYPELVDSVMHSIAMARFFMVAVLFVFLANLILATFSSGDHISCTRRTHTRIWFRTLVGTVITFGIGMFFVYFAEFGFGDGGYEKDVFHTVNKTRDMFFHTDIQTHKRWGEYFRFYFPMMAELGKILFLSIFPALALFNFAGLLRTRFTIVRHRPGEVPDFKVE